MYVATVVVLISVLMGVLLFVLAYQVISPLVVGMSVDMLSLTPKFIKSHVNNQLFAESVEAECFLGSMASQADVNELLKEFDLYQFREKHPQTL
ncbi:MAG: hypothetical protein Q4F76_01940, partial [Lachnospiraceae bacterium]|nr:hypothetical protein [Lachnospiraceae bacterium]